MRLDHVPRFIVNANHSIKYWELVADNLSEAGWSWGCVSAVDSRGRTIFVAETLPAALLNIVIDGGTDPRARMQNASGNDLCAADVSTE